MTPIAIIAAGAVSPLGEGAAAYAVGELGARPETRVVHDAELERAGLRRPRAARVTTLSAGAGVGDRAQALLSRALTLLLADLERTLPDFRRLRLGVALGTSSGGLGTLSELLGQRARAEIIQREQALSASYFGALRAFELARLEPVRVTQVLAACASSTVAMGIGCRWLEAAACEIVIAGGYDALTLFAAAGFEALGATTASAPRPFRRDRDGLALGEGAALVALVRQSHGLALGHVLGFGVGCDAVHVTAPDRTGAGLARAARAALADAHVEASRIDLISAHATATPFNDSAEGHAIAAVVGATAERVVVHPFKAIAGHTLGAAGTLETLAALSAAKQGILPAAYGEGELESEFPARLCTQNQPGNAAHILKLSTAFGGANAALVLSPQAPRRPEPARARKRVRLRALGEPQLAPDLPAIARATGISELDLQRYDRPSLLALSAIASLHAAGQLPEARNSCGVLVGTMSASLEVNELFAARLRERGVRGAEPRRFPATSPNLPAGRAAIAFGLQGPTFSVGAGPAAALEALLLGIELLEAGDAESLLVLAVEDVGAVVRDVFGAAGLPQPEPGALAALLHTGDSGMPLESTTLAAEIYESAGRAPKQAPGWPLLKRALSSARA